MASIVDWVARLYDGRQVSRREARLGNVPADAITHARVETDDPRVPVVSVKVSPGTGVKFFTRRTLRLDARAAGPPAAGGVPVIEIVPDLGRPEVFVRLYIHEGGLLLSNEDVNF